MTINGKKIILSMVATLAISSSVLAEQNKVYATVNGEKITDKEISMVLRDQRINFNSLAKEQQKKIITGIVEQTLLTNEAYKSNIVTSSEYKSELEKVKKTLAFQLWIRDLSKKVKISENEVKKFYDENKAKFKGPEQLKASHILVKTEKEAKAIISKLLTSKNLKVDFTKAAQEKSTGPSGANGGELGWFTKDKMVPEFSAAASKLSPGTITTVPVKTKFGFHIIYLDDMKKSAIVEYSKIKDRLKRDLLQEKFTKIVKEKADLLKKTAKIEYK